VRAMELVGDYGTPAEIIQALLYQSPWDEVPDQPERQSVPRPGLHPS
jgi:hypothetical protein